MTTEKLKNILRNISWYPIKRGKIDLFVPSELFYKNLDRRGEKNFDIFRSWNVDDDKKSEFQYEIDGNKFKIRQIQENNYRPRFIGTIVYGKIVKQNNISTLHFLATFNIFGSALILFTFVGIAYGLYYFVDSNFRNLSLLGISLLGYIIYITIFNTGINSDMKIIENLVS